MEMNITFNFLTMKTFIFTVIKIVCKHQTPQEQDKELRIFVHTFGRAQWQSCARAHKKMARIR
jgi:hypothetical protein